MDDRDLVRALRALGDAKRFEIVQTIAAAGELTCDALTEAFGLAQPTMSHHLKLLSDAGILHVRGDGARHVFSVNHARLDELAGLVPARLAPKKKKR